MSLATLEHTVLTGCSKHHPPHVSPMLIVKHPRFACTTELVEGLLIILTKMSRYSEIIEGTFLDCDLSIRRRRVSVVVK